MDVNKRDLLLATAIGSVAFAATASVANATAVDEVTAAEQVWLKSAKENKPDLLAPLLAANIVGVENDGSVSDKAAILKSAKDTNYVSAEYQDFKVVANGDTAVAVMLYKVTVKEGSKNVTFTVRELDSWAKIDGKWLCIATTNTPIYKFS